MKIPDPRTTFFRLATYLYFLFLSYQLLVPSPSVSSSAIIPSFVLHIGAFFVLYLFVSQGFSKDFERGRYRPIFYTYLSGVLLEVLQIFVVGRTFSFVDMGSNIFGIVLAGFCVRTVKFFTSEK